jgi:hypothetical protein
MYEVRSYDWTNYCLSTTFSISLKSGDNLIVNGYEDNQQAIIVAEERAEQGLTGAL